MAAQAGAPLNDWGQRVTSMACVGDSLYLSTSAKGNHRWEPKNDFLTEAQRKEYGAVLQLRLPGCLTAPVAWKGRPTRLDFLVQADRLAILQDGRLLGETPFAATTWPIPNGEVVWGRGVFGPLQARITESRLVR